MEFKKLELKEEGSRFKRIFLTRQSRKTYIAIGIGALAGFMYFYFSEGRHMNTLVAGDILKSMLIGGFFGFFITNSPCARGRC